MPTAPSARIFFRRLLVVLILGGVSMPQSVRADEPGEGPRKAAWQRIEKALDEGKPKTAIEALDGIERASIADKAWAEAARAIATRVFADNGDRPPDDPQSLIDLAAATSKAPPEVRPVLEAIRANWTWGFFLANRWRFSGRTQGGSADAGLESIASWDLRRIVGEVRARFADAVGATEQLQKMPVAEWSAILTRGSMPDAFRPTMWDVVVRDALAFAASGERGLVDPEDVFEFDAASPALGTPDEFLAWKPDEDRTVTDLDSPLLKSVKLYRQLLEFHRRDADRTAFLAADLDRILWAAGTAVGDGTAERAQSALEDFIARSGDHETSSLARSHLAERIFGEGDRAKARTIATAGAEAFPKSPGAALCRNLVSRVEAKELSLATERLWASPWPVIRVHYRNLAKLHLRIVKFDWLERIRSGKAHPAYLDDAERQAILAQAPVKEFAVDLPATPDFRDRSHDVPVPQDLPPGVYWVIASHAPDFGATDNVVAATGVWVSRLAMVDRSNNPQSNGPLAGHVVDVATGEPVAGANVRPFLRDQRAGQRFVEGQATTTDRDGRYELPATETSETVLVATARLDGREESISTDPMTIWHRGPEVDRRQTQVVMMTDRGIHRPGQIVFYKGIVCSADASAGDYKTLADAKMTVVLLDANGREVARHEHVTNAFGSFNGNVPIATGALPGQWNLRADGAGGTGIAVVRVEEYKRPKFQVSLASPSGDVALDREIAMPGTATTYTGLPVAGATVRWRVERETRFPIWCRWMFPWLPLSGGSARIARGTAVTDANGGFTVSFPARPDRTVPKESLPVFTYAVTADVTDASGETRSTESRLSAGYTKVEASLSTDPWQAVGEGRSDVPVAITVSTTSLDGEPRPAIGTLTVSRLVQPAAVARGDLLERPAMPMPMPRARAARPVPPPAADPTDPESWEAGEQVFRGPVETDAVTGRSIATPKLPAGIYRAELVIPGAEGSPDVKARSTVEVIDPAAVRYAVKRAFAFHPRTLSVPPRGTFEAVVGTGYGTGRVFVEVLQSGKTLSRTWTEPGRTQWPIRVDVTDAHRGGFTVRAWMVREGRLHAVERTIDVPWTNKNLKIEWERFTRRVEPASKQVWRAKVTSVDDPVAGPAAPVVAELAATLYDQSLDALSPHEWPGGLSGLLRHEWSGLPPIFTNGPQTLFTIHGAWKSHHEGVDISYRELREPFGEPSGGFGMRRGRMLARGMARGAPMMAEMAMTADAAAAMPTEKAAENRGDREQGPGAPSPQTATAAPPPPRRNLAETAFFLPTLTSHADGVVSIEFTLPDTLTTWQFKAIAHDAALRSGSLLATCIAAKDLMVEPVVPRFAREGDTIRIPVKVSNTSTGRLAGTVKFSLSDARSGDARDTLVEGAREQPFDLAAGESRPVEFTVKVADGTDVLTYLATGVAGKAADGEEGMLPVLPRKVLVAESVPVTIRGPGTRKVVLEKLAKPSDSIESQSLVVQAASNPAWYAVLALPCLMEETDESVDSLFRRLYANSLARHVAASDPGIARVFEQWRGGGTALQSPLEKNEDLVKTLLAETPWVRDAVDEREARGRIALLFDATRNANEIAAATARLETLRNADGGWPWFPGGSSCDAVTLSIAAGYGRLRASGVAIDVQPALATIPWMDRRLVEEEARGRNLAKDENDAIVLTPLGVFALYARSFFTQDIPPDERAARAIRWCLDVGKRSWMRLAGRRSQGQLAIALSRAGEKPTALSILDSLKQRAVGADVERGEEEENWQGMWWRDPHPVWWNWYDAPIETQALLIEAFDEVAGDAAAVEAMKAWLLSQKRTSRWPGAAATADAVAALLRRGGDLLASKELVSVTIGGDVVKPESIEAGTGFFETRLVRREAGPKQSQITIEKKDAGIAWGGIHWQYLDDIANVAAAGRGELAIDKKLFLKRSTKAGEELVPAGNDGATVVDVGDELVVRLVVTSDRDYEFLELSDHRPSLAEPVELLSGWRWGDGVGWYAAVRDTSVQFFFERLPRGTHVFEYSLRAAHRGSASSGFARIQSRYAPEFSAHSGSTQIGVR